MGEKAKKKKDKEEKEAQRQKELAQKKAAKIAAKEAKRKEDEAKKAAEAAAAGEEKKEGEEKKDGEEKKAEEEKKDEPKPIEIDEESDEEEEKKEEEPEEEDPEPPKVELTPEEKKMWHQKSVIPDLAPIAMSSAFPQFSLPEKDEGFEEIRYEWEKQGKKCQEYVKNWVLERKLTTRVENLTPGEWFQTKWKAWNTLIGQWRTKQTEFKTKEI